jgi:hypothetical protein
MQPLAIAAITASVAMLIGVSATMWLTRRDAGLRAAVNRWQWRASLPLNMAGTALGVLGWVAAGTPVPHTMSSGWLRPCCSPRRWRAGS